MATLAKAYVQIVPSAEGIKGSIENVLGEESKRAGSMAGTNIVGSLKKVIVGAALGKILTDSLMEGAKLQQSIGGIETLFKDSADRMKNYANEAYKTAGISANSYMEQATSFSASLLASLGGDTAKAADVANQAIIDMADNSNKMGTAIENIQNAYQGFAKQNYTMLDNLKLGYGGTKTEMERLLADAQKLTGVKYDINNLSDVYNAIHVIQENLGITGSTATEASSTFSGSLNAMKAACQNFLGSLMLGENLTPALTGLVKTTVTFLFNNLLPAVANIIMAIPEVIVAGVPMIMQEGKVLLEKLIEAIKNEFPNLLNTGTSSIVEFINGFFAKWPEIIQMGGDLVAQLVEALIEKAPSIMESAFTIISSFISGFLKSLPKILEIGFTLVGKIAAGIIKGIPRLLGKSLTIHTKIAKQFASLNWAKIGIDIINGIIRGITSMLGSIGKAAINAAKTALNAIKDFLDIHSPSRVFETQVGKMISLGLAGGIEDNLKPVTNAMDTLNAETLGMIDRDFSINKNVAVNNNSQSDVFSKVLDVLSSIEAKTEKDYSFSINGRQLAYALGGDMNIVLNQINQRESRGR